MRIFLAGTSLIGEACGDPARTHKAIGRVAGRQAAGVAELGAAFLCADLAVTPMLRDDHAQYIDHWLKIMKADRRAIFTAAGKANQVLEYLHGLQQAKAA
ncbi:MAG: zincin-like metallopeptidase domain-containing protein [Hyphomicrobiaceae bacterium]